MKKLTALLSLAAILISACSKPIDGPSVKPEDKDEKDNVPVLTSPADASTADLSTAKTLAFKWSVKTMSPTYSLCIYAEDGDTPLKTYKASSTQYNVPVADLKALMEANTGSDQLEFQIRWNVKALSQSGSAGSDDRTLTLSWPDRGEVPDTPVDPTPSGTSNARWSPLADSCTYVLIETYMKKDKGCFKNRPGDTGCTSGTYWQQSHSINVVNQAYRRIRNTDPARAAEYKDYLEKWYANDANNYNKSHTSDGKYGHFFNAYTDDMAWICLSLLDLSETFGKDEYAEVARDVFDKYMMPRWMQNPENGKWGLPWTNISDKQGLNACTNAPACAVACRLYMKWQNSKHLEDALKIYGHVYNDIYEPSTGRVEQTPLTYTQGTFAEACRLLYHITKENHYLETAYDALNFAFTNSRCTSNYTLRGQQVKVLRQEGASMDQALFKAVLIPYAVNYILDESAPKSNRDALLTHLIHNGEALENTLDRSTWPKMIAPFCWGVSWKTWASNQNKDNPDAEINSHGDGTLEGYKPCMSTQASGASLMEGLARLPEGLI